MNSLEKAHGYNNAIRTIDYENIPSGTITVSELFGRYDEGESHSTMGFSSFFLEWISPHFDYIPCDCCLEPAEFIYRDAQINKPFFLCKFCYNSIMLDNELEQIFWGDKISGNGNREGLGRGSGILLRLRKKLEKYKRRGVKISVNAKNVY